MSDAKRGRGIVDPWRKVEPLRAPPRTPAVERERIDLDDIDRDADLAVPGRYIIRSEHACFDVTSTRVETPADALEVLADCVCTLFMNKAIGTTLIDAGIGIRFRDRAWNVPSEETPASQLTGGKAVIWFVEMPLDQGMLVLAKILRTIAVSTTLRRYGIVVMLTAS